MSAYAPPTRSTIPPGVPPFKGPPPMPPNIKVNQQQWNAGRWQFNSTFSNQCPAPHQGQIPWRPGLATDVPTLSSATTTTTTTERSQPLQKARQRAKCWVYGFKTFRQPLRPSWPRSCAKPLWRWRPTRRSDTVDLESQWTCRWRYPSTRN